uniref:Uncharacterized protein n=1 Tax=Cacopsylla melanoneura TaxID=428564 RepID=A0A8D8ZF56_9HEMI
MRREGKHAVFPACYMKNAPLVLSVLFQPAQITNIATFYTRLIGDAILSLVFSFYVKQTILVIVSPWFKKYICVQFQFLNIFFFFFFRIFLLSLYFPKFWPTQFSHFWTNYSLRTPKKLVSAIGRLCVCVCVCLSVNRISRER